MIQNFEDLSGVDKAFYVLDGLLFIVGYAFLGIGLIQSDMFPLVFGAFVILEHQIRKHGVEE